MDNSVREFYKDKTIFITGGSGYMGKVLVEKLLYSCSDLKEIILLMRPKKGKTQEMRVKEFETLPLFERIMNEKPEMMTKIHPVWGDISEVNFGLSDEHMSYVIENSQIVFHLAASLKLEASLKTNINMNLTAVKQICDISKQMRNLLVMIHTSTAFCIVEHENIKEKVYDVDINPLEVIECAKKVSDTEMSILQKRMLGKHLNTYTYTKRLAEVLVRNEFDVGVNNNYVPFCIVRPSIVSPTLAEPMVGWVDSLNGAPGIVYAGASGILRCMLMDESAIKNFIPVDTVINGFILIAQHIANLKERPEEIPVFNLTTHKSNILTFGEYTEIVKELKFEVPLSLSIWYPNTTNTNNRLYYYLNILLFQWIPALFFDLLLLIFMQRPIMLKIQKKLFIGIEGLKTFTLRKYVFETDNFDSLIKSQSLEDFKTFNIDTRAIDCEKFFKNAVKGGRLFLTKEPLSTVPRAKIVIRTQQVIYYVVNALLFYWIGMKAMDYFK